MVDNGGEGMEDLGLGLENGARKEVRSNF